MTDKPLLLLDLLSATTEYFTKKGIESARLEAERLLSKALGIKRLELYLQFDRELTSAETDEYRESIRRRGSGEPLQYILGETEFYSIPIAVAPGVLIPRPETETLVSLAVGMLSGVVRPRICDVGTGSGCIALALAESLNQAQIVATDISPSAIVIAEGNIVAAGKEDQITLVETDLFAGLEEQKFHAVVSNPPYIPLGDMESLPMDVRDHEPEVALFGGEDGLEVLERLIRGSEQVLEHTGFLAIEVGMGQSQRVSELIADLIPNSEVSVHLDLSGIERVVVARLLG